MKILNQLINLFWTALAFSLPFFHWYSSWDPVWFCGSVLAAGASLPLGLKSLRFSSNRRFYERAGVRVVRKVVQDGTLVRRQERKSSPNGHVVAGKSYESYLRTTALYEKFHWMCGVFFLLSSLHAFVLGSYLLSAGIVVVNIGYNLYPIFLQQYNRNRISGLLDRQQR